MMVCRACKSETFEPVIDGQDIYECGDCHSLFRGTLVDYQRYIACDYWYVGDKELKLHQKSLFGWFEDLILDGPSIEFGAADGDTVNSIRNIVSSEHMVVYNELKDLLRPEYRSKKIHTNVGTFENFEADHRFDNVVMIEVLEHLNDVPGAFSKVNDLLNVGGRFFISTDNGDSSPHRLNSIFMHWEHTVILTKVAISMLASQNGFRIIQYFTNPFGISFIVLQKQEEVGYEN